jgi:hypothetical protein
MIMDPVHGWRDASKADLVGLVTADGDCGWGYTPQTAGADTTDHLGFIVLRRSCLNTNISLAHEFGHNMGALHNRANAGTSDLTPPYNFGHQQPVPSDSSNTAWRTVMAYGCTGVTCTRVTQYSNPNVSFPATNGDPSGVPLSEAEPEHNVMVFALNDAEVAKYRCSRTDQNVANVWGKDTWSDTGLEPDPATAGQPMWRSPYIWVRNQQDTTLQFEHAHENPNISADPHVYVKLHNDGNLSEAGDVELYYASAATNLNDPASWTLISGQSTTMNTGVEVFEFPWSSLPGTGHYCLLARWNSTSTPLSFASLNDFVRGDGGVIWRNVNIIDLGGDLEEDRVFLVRGDREIKETFLRIVTQPAVDLKIPWAEMVEATIVIDPEALPKQLELIGLKGQDGKFQVPLDDRLKFLGPLVLSPKDVVKGALYIESNRRLVDEVREKFGNDPRYTLSVQQVRADAVSELMKLGPRQPWPDNLILGGVDYTWTLQKGE